MDNNLLNEAIEAGKEGRIEDWLHPFLLASGNNKKLSDGLKGELRHWLGPVEVQLSKLERVVGPELGMEYHEAEEDLNRRVSEMVNNINNGWTPPPLIVEFKNNTLKIRDGGHRHEALLNSDHKTYWTIFWANTEEDFKELKSKLNSLK